MSTIKRFSVIDKAILVTTGNSLVVCGSTTAPAVNTSELIKPNGSTTRDWTEAGSVASLNLLENSTVLYAELIWYSTVFINVAGVTDLRSVQDNSITFVTSKGSYQITPQFTDSTTGLSGTIDRFRAADVTSYVQAALSGSYTVSNVPICIPSTGLSNSRAGWSLTVIYRNDSFKPQKVIYYSGIAVATPSTPLQTTVTGFTTPSNDASLKGNITLVCANGSPLNGQEIAYAGPSFAQLSNIGNTVYSPNPNPGTAPNNPGNSFFTGAINVANPISDNNGLININGTNGTNNNDGFVPKQALGARNKWDITNVDISDTLVTNQTILAGQIITTGQIYDGVELVALGTQVLAKAPNITSTLIAYDIDRDTEYNAEVEEALVYAIQIKNDGDVAANNVIVSAVLDSSTTFIAGSVTINGIANPNANILNGINLGSISAKGIVNVLFLVRVDSVPIGRTLYQNVNYNYQFISGIDTITNYGKTNTIEIIVQDGNLSVLKSASKSNMYVNESVTYTINVQNVGTEQAKDVFFQEKMDEGCSFVEGTVVINGIVHSNYDPVAGFYIEDLNVGTSTQIIFQSKVNSLPASTKVSNVSCISFGYIFNEYGYPYKKTVFSNVTSIQVLYIDVIGQRCNDNNYPKVGDTVKYKLSLTNMGNIDATNIQVLESAIPGASFVSGSVKINGSIQSTLNPFTGFILSNSIAPKATTDIEYNVLINSINTVNLIENIAKIPFKYQISQDSTIINEEKDSNSVDTIANYVCMDIVKSVDKSYALIEDILYYKVKVSNSGNINAINTVFLDSIQSNVSFIPGTVTINGISYPVYNPNQGFTIGTICPDDNVEVAFQVKVNTLPTPNIIYNNSSLVYGYKPDPYGSTLNNTIFSNTVQTIINTANYTVVKTVDKTYAQVGDIIVYTTTIENTGTVVLTDVEFSDFLGIYLSLYPGSIYINGINYPDYDINGQISLGNIHPKDNVTVSFAARIMGNPSVGFVPNMSEVTLTYKKNPNTPVITKTVRSNEVRTYVPYASIALVKSVDKSYSMVGETLTYTFTATNNGSSTAINTLFSDIIQAEASFVAGSVLVNGVNKQSYNPQIGFTLGDIVTGQVVTVEFKVKVNSLPTPNIIKNNATTSYSYYINPTQQPVTKNITSNTVTTVINSYSATLTKSVNKAYATVGDILDYTVVAANTGTVTLTNVNFIDLIPAGAAFVVGSVILDGVSLPQANPNTGFVINDVLPGGNVVVMFKASVTSVPKPPQIKNIASINLKYKLSPTSSYINDSLTSNTATTNINSMSVTNTKSVSKSYATIGDTLTYTSVIANNGNVIIANTEFIDNIPSDTTFVSKSVKINGTSYEDYDPNVGFTLEAVNPGSTTTVTFDVTVKSVPLSGYITNASTINYQYKIDPTAPYISSNVTSNTATTYINLGNLTVTKVADRNIVRLNNVINYSFVITNTGNTVLKNLVFKDIVQSESSFNTGTVYVNENNITSYDPNNGFVLNDIPVGQQATVSFTVRANSIPQDNKLLNTANVTYSYNVDPNGALTTNTKPSSTTIVYVYDTIVSANKAVDKTIAKIGDTLNFTITIKNDGNVPAQNVVFKDVLDSNISFVTGSIYINNVQTTDPSINPTAGFSLTDIAGGATTTVKFAVIVARRPADNIVYNYAAINYDYTIDLKTTQANMNTNTTQTYVAVGELTVTKSVDKLYATVGDNLAYTVIVKNTGSVNATSIKAQDLIPASTSFVTGTVVIDGTSMASLNPNVLFTLTDLTPNQYHTITFNVHVDSLPESGKVNNTADVTFSYKLTPTDDVVTITTHSNIVTTYIKLGYLTATKSVDKAYATIGNTLNYTVTLNNAGNANCLEVFFKDIIQLNASFVTGSVKINSVAHTDYNPNVGFYLDDIPGYGNTVITFAVTVKTLPQDYIIYNNATDSYKYYIDPDNPPVVTEKNTNTVTTMINVGSLTATKAVSKNYATIDDVLTYTVTIVNTGNTVAKNINFRDVIPSGLTFVAGSVTINGISYSNYNPYGSFTLGNVISGDTVIVKFDAKVTLLPTPSLASNTANLVFSYSIDPNGSDITVEVNSNTVTTQINLGSLTITKSVDKAYAAKGYILTYSLIITNNGNVRADDVMFTDSLQSDVIFNTGSVKVNSITQPDSNPNSGISLVNIEPLDHVNITFTVTVIDSPIQDVVLNYALGNFSYKIDPNGNYYSKSSQSNTVATLIIKPSLSSTKIVDKLYSTLQDILNYSILVKNSGNIPISKLFFSDFLSNGAIFKVGTVAVDGTNYPTYDPIIGFNLPNDLEAGNTSLVEFESTITTLPSPPQVTNYSVSNGEYYVDPNGESYSIAATSNTVATNVNIGSLSNIKTVDKMYGKVNDTIRYTSTITNTGNVNATNLYFTDMLQSELLFVAGTVSINGVIYPSLNPTTGFALSDLGSGQTVTVEFSAKINALPTPAYVTNNSNISFVYKIDPNGTTITKNQISNTVTTYVVLGKLNVSKIVDKAIATIGDVLTYTITLTNVGNVIDSNVSFQDNPSEGVAFKAGSVKVNGISQPNSNPITGFSLGDIGIGNVVTVQFEVNVISVPQTNKVTNQAVSIFKYTIDPKQQQYTDTTYSNTVTTNIAYGSLSVTKAVNKQFATIGEQITYTISIVNIGNINATNVIFKDPIPHNTMFIVGSVTINGVLYPDYNPSAGFDLNTMTPGQIITVVYKVQVLKLC